MKGHDVIGDEFRARFGETHAGWAFMVLFVAEVNPFTKRALHLPRTYPQRPKTVAADSGGGGGEGEAEVRSPAKAAAAVAALSGVKRGAPKATAAATQKAKKAKAKKKLSTAVKKKPATRKSTRNATRA